MIFNVGAGGASTAEAVQYDNSLSGLEATNVQGALDKVTDSLDTVNNNLNKVKTVSTDVKFTSGKGTYTDNFITENSRIVATRVLTNSGVSGIIAGAKAYNGYCELFYSSNTISGTDPVTIMIDNR